MRLEIKHSPANFKKKRKRKEKPRPFSNRETYIIVLISSSYNHNTISSMFIIQRLNKYTAYKHKYCFYWRIEKWSFRYNFPIEFPKAYLWHHHQNSSHATQAVSVKHFQLTIILKSLRIDLNLFRGK